MFFFRYHGYDARFVVWFSRVDFITYLHDLFILIFVSSSSSSSSSRRRRLRRRMSMQKFSFC
jgi:Na+/H+-dicarboxylate symporter